MFCAKCGAALVNGAKFCAQCGAAAGTVVAGSRLVRPLAGRKIAGVCAAFANGYGWDLTVTRIVALLLALCGCGGVIAYLVAWVCIPNEPELPYAPSEHPPVSAA